MKYFYNTNQGINAKPFILFILFLLLSITCFAQKPTIKIVAHYPFNGDAIDESNNENDGVVNGPTLGLDRFGNQGYAYEFDGIDDFIKIPVNINPKTLPLCTITMWVKFKDSGVRTKVFSHDDGGYDRTIGLDNRDGGSGWSAFSGSGSVLGYHSVSDEWTFIAVVYDQLYTVNDSVSGIVKLYVNDSLYTEYGKTGNGLDYVTLGTNPTFGGFFSGSIDDIRIYNGELSKNQIYNLRNEANPLPGPEVLWTKTYGGLIYDTGKSIVENTDKGLMIVTQTSVDEKNDAIEIIMTDESGDLKDSYIYGLEDKTRISNCFTTPNYGSFILGRYTSSFKDAMITKVSPKGEFHWEIEYEDYFQFYSLTPIGYGHFAAVAVADAKLVFVRLKSDGSVYLDKTYDLRFGVNWIQMDKRANILWTSANQLMIVASEIIANKKHIVLLKTDLFGDVIWKKNYSKYPEDDEYGFDIVETPDNGFLVLAGRKQNSFILKIDKDGNEVWFKEYLGIFEEFKVTKDGNYILAGSVQTNNIIGNGQNDIWLNMIDQDGVTLWSKNLEGDYDDKGYDIYETADGGFLITGSSNSYSGTSKEETIIVRLKGNDVTTALPSDASPKQFELGQNYPNPFNPTTTIKYSIPNAEKVQLMVHNLLGQQVATLVDGYQNAGAYSIDWNASQLSSGVYFYILQAGHWRKVKKMMLVK